jgi:hypothetical protein
MSQIAPRGIAFTGKETWIGGVDGVPLSRIRAWAMRVWKALAEALQESGREPSTDLHRSVVEGDGDLSWPAERLRYGWRIPHISEDEWPTQPMPDDIADLLIRKFQRLRGRDPND